jgi:CRP/FNR family transcriptional regulator
MASITGNGRRQAVARVHRAAESSSGNGYGAEGFTNPIVTLVSCPAGCEVFPAAHTSTGFWRVASGYVRTYTMLHDGRSINLAILGPGDIAAPDTRDTYGPSGIVAEALTDATIELIDRGAFSEILALQPSLCMALIKSQQRQIATLSTLVEQLLARDTSVRLAATLLQLADVLGELEPDGYVMIALPIRHQALADMIGSNRVTVTRKLAQLERVDAVRSTQRGRLSVDLDQLRGIAGLE